MFPALIALVLSALASSRQKLASWGLGQSPLNARQVRAVEAEKRAGEILLEAVESWWGKQFQHLGPTPCDSNVTRACIAALNAGVAAPSADFTAGALTWAATYDPNGNLATTFDPKLQSCVHSFGLLNRLTSQLYTHLAGRELPSLDSITYSYTPNGSLQTVVETKRTSSSATSMEQTTRGFDALERMTSQTRDYGATQKTTLFGYDVKGNRTSVTDSAGASTVYTFDSVDRLKVATTPNGRAEYFYFADGLLQRTEYRPSAGAQPTTVEKRCYDNASRLTTLASGVPNFMGDDCPAAMPGIFFSRFDYALDANGNRTSQLERRASTNELTEYGYDDLDRLVATVEPSEAKLYQLDAVGNRVGEKKTTPAAARLLGLAAAAFVALAPADTLAHVRGHFNRVDWLTQRESLVPAAAPINFLHDANGNTTSEQSATSLREYKWDSRNTLTAAFIDGVDVGRYSYDWQMQRVSRAAGGSTVEYVLDDKLVLQELDSAHSATRRYHFGALSPLGVSDSAGPRWLLNDGLGSVSDEVTPSGGLFKQRQYNAWGEYRNSTAPAVNEPKLGYEGHQFDPETSLTYARARYLDNRYGVLLSRDAVEGAINDAPSLHRYTWARVGPLRFLDFSGNATDFASEVGEDLRQQRADRLAAEEARRQKETGGLPEFDPEEAKDRNELNRYYKFLNADLSKAPRHIRQQQDQARQLEFLMGATMEGSKLVVEGAVVYFGGEVVGIMVGGVLRPLGTALERDLAAGGRAVAQEGEGAAGAVVRPKLEVPGGVGGGKAPPGGVGGGVPPGGGGGGAPPGGVPPTKEPLLLPEGSVPKQLPAGGQPRMERIKAELEAAAAGTQGQGQFVVSPSGKAIPTSRARLESGFQEAGFPSYPNRRTPEVGTNYVDPQTGNIHRVMQGAGPHPARLITHSPGPGTPPVLPTGEPIPSGLRGDAVRDVTHLPLEP